MPLAFTILKSRWLHYALAAIAIFALNGRVNYWHGRFDALISEARTVTEAISVATGGGSVKWADAAKQVLALGDSNRTLKTEIADTNARLDDLARQAIAAKAESAQLRAIADKAVAQRRAAYRRLSDQRAAPAVRRDCESQVEEANAALDLLREQGF